MRKKMYGGINLRAELPGMVWTDEAQYFTPYAHELLQKRGPPPLARWSCIEDHLANAFSLAQGIY